MILNHEVEFRRSQCNALRLCIGRRPLAPDPDPRPPAPDPRIYATSGTSSTNSGAARRYSAALRLARMAS